LSYQADESGRPPGINPLIFDKRPVVRFVPAAAPRPAIPLEFDGSIYSSLKPRKIDNDASYQHLCDPSRRQQGRFSDVIYRIDPTDTPAMSESEREKATAANHEWQTQALPFVDTGDALLQGDDTKDAATPTARLGSICQISDKVARVSGTQRTRRGDAGRVPGDAQWP
jgi:hypothetical protein